MMSERALSRVFYLGFFVVSASLLMLQMLYSRASDVALGPGLVFIIISSAILGIGLGGLVVFFAFNAFTSPRTIHRALLLASLLYVLSIPVPFIILDPGRELSILTFFLTGFLTYSLGGIIQALVFRYYAAQTPQLYGVSLCGSAVGALGVICMLEWVGMPHTILGVLLLAAGAPLCYALAAGFSKPRLGLSLLLLACISLWPLSQLTSAVQIVCPDRGTPIFSRSNAFSQVDTYALNNSYRMLIDCRIGAKLFTYQPGLKEKTLKHQLFYFPFLVKPYSSILIIGAGGGREVQAAVAAGTSRITAVEINPLITEITALLAGPENIYDHEAVTLVVQEGRSFINASADRYDLIYSTSKNFGDLGYSRHMDTEHYLYTTEAVEAYFQHLTADGLLAVRDKEPFFHRVTATVVRSLLERGIDPMTRILIVESTTTFKGASGGPVMLMLVKNSEWSPLERVRFREQAVAARLKTRELTAQEVAKYGAVTPLTDDNPYFWNKNMIGQMFLARDNKVFSTPADWMKAPPGAHRHSLAFKYIPELLLALILSYLLAVLLPLWKVPHLRSRATLSLVGFFSAVGIGFITLEMTFIHRLTLLLGHPLLSVAVTLATVCFFGGLGSLLTRTFPEHDIPGQLAKAVLPLAGIIIGMAFSAPWLFNTFGALAPAIKILGAVALLAIPGFCMGMIFPLGLKLARRTSATLIPWMVGIDGITSVMGGIFSFLVSAFFGFNAALLFGIAMYLFAVWMVFRVKQN